MALDGFAPTRNRVVVLTSSRVKNSVANLRLIVQTLPHHCTLEDK
jgi:hypothetical protein